VAAFGVLANCLSGRVVGTVFRIWIVQKVRSTFLEKDNGSVDTSCVRQSLILFLEVTSAGCFEQSKSQYNASSTTPLREFLQNTNKQTHVLITKDKLGKPPWKAAESAGKFSGKAI